MPPIISRPVIFCVLINGMYLRYIIAHLRASCDYIHRAGTVKFLDDFIIAIKSVNDKN